MGGGDEFLWVTSASSMRYGGASAGGAGGGVASAAPHQEPLDLRPQGCESPLDAVGPWVHHAASLHAASLHASRAARSGADYADAHLAHPCHPAHHHQVKIIQKSRKLGSATRVASSRLWLPNPGFGIPWKTN